MCLPNSQKCYIDILLILTYTQKSHIVATYKTSNMDSPDPKENTAIDIYQREFTNTEKQQIAHDLQLLEGKWHSTIKEQFITSRRLSELVIKMYQKRVLELSADEFEILASGIVTQEMRDLIKENFLSQTDAE